MTNRYGSASLTTQPLRRPSHPEGPFLESGWGHWNFRCEGFFDPLTLIGSPHVNPREDTGPQSSGEKHQAAL